MKKSNKKDIFFMKFFLELSLALPLLTAFAGLSVYLNYSFLSWLMFLTMLFVENITLLIFIFILGWKEKIIK